MPYKNKADKNKRAAIRYRERMQEIVGKVQLARRERKRQLVAYKGGKCSDCGGVFPAICFDFDHRDVHAKSFEIGRRIGYSLEKLLVEVEKCDLVCANCHRIRTDTNPEIAAKIRRLRETGWYAPAK
jgi:hypothetical protein